MNFCGSRRCHHAADGSLSGRRNNRNGGLIFNHAGSHARGGHTDGNGGQSDGHFVFGGKVRKTGSFSFLSGFFRLCQQTARGTHGINRGIGRGDFRPRGGQTDTDSRTDDGAFGKFIGRAVFLRHFLIPGLDVFNDLVQNGNAFDLLLNTAADIHILTAGGRSVVIQSVRGKFYCRCVIQRSCHPKSPKYKSLLLCKINKSGTFVYFFVTVS